MDTPRRSILAVLACAICTSPLAAPLFKPLEGAKSARAPEAMIAARAVAVDRAAVLAAGAGGSLEATLPNGLAVSIAIDTLEHHENGDVSWTGKVLDTVRTDLLATGTSGAAGSFAELQTRGGTWGIVPSGDGHEWLFDRTSTLETLPHPISADDWIRPPVITHDPRPKLVCPTVSSMPAPQVTIDLLFVLAPDFVSAFGGAAAADTRVNNLVTSMNAYNAASNIAITYRRVGLINANYGPASAGDDNPALNAITQGTGVFANIGALRNFYGADMVALMRGPVSATQNSASISGLAWLNGDGNGGHADVNFMYSVNGDHPFFNGTLPAHELGHNLGNAHDRPNAGSSVGTTSYSYGHFVCGTGASAACGQQGFNQTGTGFGTIMSYHRPTVPKFASPAITCQGTQGGALSAPCGVDNQQDDVRAMNCIRQSVAAFKGSWVGGSCANLTQDTDNDGIPDCLEAGSGRVNGARDNDVFSNALLFSAQQYRDFLSREGDADGMNFWISALNTATLTRGQMAEAYFNSAEFQGVIAPVARLYFAYFLRIPDYAGLQFWISQFKTGMPLATISNNFAASAEFITRYGALTNAQFVTQIYQNVLGRAPDAGGLAFWTGQLDSLAMTRGQVMVGFSDSPEYIGFIGNEVYVTMMYMGMLRRAPDQGGFDFWVGYLDGGNSGLALINGFLAASEYRSRFLP